jgi:hypothetical protein
MSDLRVIREEEFRRFVGVVDRIASLVERMAKGTEHERDARFVAISVGKIYAHLVLGE